MESSIKEGTTDRNKTLVLFDIGSVLLHLDYDAFFSEAAKLSVDGKSAEDVKNAYIDRELDPRVHIGALSTQEYFTAIEEIINHREKLSDKKLKELVGMRYTGPIAPVVELKRRVYHAGYAVGVFSNTCEIDVQIWAGKYPGLIETFDPSYPSIFSFNVGATKPEPPMYRQIQGFEKVIFIDDKPSYLRTGIEQFGWNGILFTPFIDESEALRAVHTDKTQPSHNFRVANSIPELTESLQYFGIEV